MKQAFIAAMILMACGGEQAQEGCAVPLAWLEPRVAEDFWVAAQRWERATGCEVVPAEEGLVVKLEEQPELEDGTPRDAVYSRRSNTITFKTSKVASPDAEQIMTHELGHRLGFKGHHDHGLMAPDLVPGAPITAQVLDEICSVSPCSWISPEA